MQTVTATYRALWEDPRWITEHRAVIAGEIYTQSVNLMSAPKVVGSLWGTGSPKVGCCVSRQLDIMVMPMGDIPRMAEIRLETRLVLKDPLTEEITSASEWLPKGTFYIDTRQTDSASGALRIHGYDAMLKMEQLYLADGEDVTGWPKTMPAVMEEIAAAIGVELDERNVLIDTYMVEAPAGYTMREVAGWIAAAHAGNWTMTDAGKLRLVPIAGIPAETYYLVDENGNYILLGGDRIVIGSGEEVTRELPGWAAKVWVGNAATNLQTSPAFAPFTGVTVWYDDELAYQSGDDSGRRLELDCPWASQEMADGILASISGYAYQPYTASGAVLDPAAELGDGVTVGGLYSVIATANIVFDALCVADISAPSDEEVDHEYPYESRTTREMKRKVTLGKDYFGAKISKANGLEIFKTAVDGTKKSRAVFNSDVLAMYNDDGAEALYFDSNAGKFKFRGDVIVTGGSMNINNNFIVDEKGNLTINGNINLSGGSITWGKNNPADGSGISANQARTIISEELVSSPNIAGGRFLDIDQNNWVEMGEVQLSNGLTTIGYFHHYCKGYSSTDPVMVMGYSNPTTVSPNWVLAPFYNIALDYLLSDETMYAMGNWDFSNAVVSGLDGVGGGDVTVIPVWG